MLLLLRPGVTSGNVLVCEMVAGRMDAETDVQRLDKSDSKTGGRSLSFA